MRPEFLSRIDEIIIFHSLDEEAFVKIANLMLNEYVGSMEERGIRFTYDDAACRWLASHAIGGKSGARDLRNLIRREVEDKVASAIVERCDGAIAGIHVTAQDDKIRLDIL